MLESEQKSENKTLVMPGFSDDDPNLDDDDQGVPRRSSRRAWIISLCIIVLIIVLVPTAFLAWRSLRPQRTTFLFQSVTTGDLSLVVSATGPVQGRVYAADFLTSGKISEIDVSVGQYVKAGIVLARLDPTALQDALNQARDTLQQQKDFGTQDAINIAQDQVNTAQHNLDNATLKAPHAGVITAINGAVGGTPASAATGFIQIVDASALQVQANVNESDIGGITVGQAVHFTVSAFGGRTFKGTISAISPLGQNTSNVVTYPVTVTVDMKGLQGVNLLPGMTASVTITVATRLNVLLIPVDAVNFAQSANVISDSDRNAALAQSRQMLASLQSSNTPAAKDNPTASYVTELVNGHWQAKPVVLGLSDGTSYEVIQGLEPGENIAVGQSASSAGTIGRPGSGSGG